MPELPEVQTVINILKNKLINKKILDYEIYYEKMIENLDDFKLIKNKTVKDIKRLGKFIIFDLDNLYLISHLRMEGKYFIKDLNEPIIKHEHVRFIFDDFILTYNDTRKFGTMCIRGNDLYDLLPLSKVNKDPFDISFIEFKNNLKNKQIKEILLDQSIISGIGNIYADEILYKSNIMPNRLANTLNDKEILDILENSKIILNEAILDGGTTIRSYLSGLNETGHHQDKLLIHTKTKCFNNHDVLKMKIGGRTTYYCPICQK